MTPRVDRYIRIQQLREARHAETWDDIIRRVREARQAAINRVPERKEART